MVIQIQDDTKDAKIKCNRLKPSCEACQVFNCACVYGMKSQLDVDFRHQLMIADAVPKKRGPKTDVLEALLKRVNGLEERLKDETKVESDSGTSDEVSKMWRHQAKNVVPATEHPPRETQRENNRDDLPRSVPVAERNLLYEILVKQLLHG